MNEHEVAWQQISASGKITTKRKAFPTEEARDRYIDKLIDKNNFWQILAVR